MILVWSQVEEFLGPHPDYDEEEEERKYYRRKKLGVVKNVVGASVAGMIVYSVYMGEHACCILLHPSLVPTDVFIANCRPINIVLSTSSEIFTLLFCDEISY